MKLTRSVVIMINEIARAFHYAGDLLMWHADMKRQERKLERKARKKMRRERSAGAESREKREADDHAVPGAIEPGSPEFFDRAARELSDPFRIGGVDISKIPVGPPADPGPIGPPAP